MEKTRTIVPIRPLDLRRTLGVTGLIGPLSRIHQGGFWRAARTPDGPGTIRMSITAGGELEATAWGVGADWLLDRLPDMVGEHDDVEAFTPHDDVVRQMAKRGRGLRLPAVGTLFDVLIPVIVEQKVTGVASGRSIRRLTWEFGEPAPGPGQLRLLPDPERLAQMPYYDFHPLGIEKRRADALIAACRAARRLQAAVERGPDDLTRAMESIRGIGPWTSARVRMVVLGDTDAVPVGDYHIPNSVTWALAAEERGTDERMLELLAPYEGQRGRVVRLVEVYGGHAPAYGPKLAPRSFDRH